MRGLDLESLLPNAAQWEMFVVFVEARGAIVIIIAGWPMKTLHFCSEALTS